MPTKYEIKIHNYLYDYDSSDDEYYGSDLMAIKRLEILKWFSKIPKKVHLENPYIEEKVKKNKKCLIM